MHYPIAMVPQRAGVPPLGCYQQRRPLKTCLRKGVALYCDAADAHLVLTLPRQRWNHPISLACSWKAVFKTASAPQRDPAVNDLIWQLLGSRLHSVKPWTIASITVVGVEILEKVFVRSSRLCCLGSCAAGWEQVNTCCRVSSSWLQMGQKKDWP